MPAQRDGLEPPVVGRAPDGRVLVLQQHPHRLHRPPARARGPDPLPAAAYVGVRLNWIAFRFPRLSWLVKSPSQPVIEDGRILYVGLRRELLTKDDLMAQLREQGVDDVGTVQKAHVEANGSLNVIMRGRAGQRRRVVVGAALTHLEVDHARAVRVAGARFASDLAGAAWARFMVALGEQAERLRRAVLDAGHGPDQARLAAAHFEAAARDEWVWLEAAESGARPG